MIFAAAMSSLDSEITALSSATIMDFYRRWFRADATDAHRLLVSRMATLGWGLFACGVAFHAGQLGSLIEAVNQIGSFFFGVLFLRSVLPGIFLLWRSLFGGLFVGVPFSFFRWRKGPVRLFE